MSEAKKIRDGRVSSQAAQCAHVIKSWYLKKGLEFFKTRKFKDSEERLLEEFTDFCLDDLDKLASLK